MCRQIGRRPDGDHENVSDGAKVSTEIPKASRTIGSTASTTLTEPPSAGLATAVCRMNATTESYRSSKRALGAGGAWIAPWTMFAWKG